MCACVCVCVCDVINMAEGVQKRGRIVKALN